MFAHCDRVGRRTVCEQLCESRTQFEASCVFCVCPQTRVGGTTKVSEKGATRVRPSRHMLIGNLFAFIFKCRAHYTRRSGKCQMSQYMQSNEEDKANASAFGKGPLSKCYKVKSELASHETPSLIHFRSERKLRATDTRVSTVASDFYKDSLS